MMVRYNTLLKVIETNLEKCKPKSSSNVSLGMPSYSFEDVIEEDFQENSGKNAIMRKQMKLQDSECDFSDREIALLGMFFSADYEWINGLIYGMENDLIDFYGKDTVDEWKRNHQSAITNLDSAIAKSIPLQQNTVLYRNGIIDESLAVGEVGKWDGYSSTSFNREGILKKDEYNIKILAVKGVKGICANGEPKNSNGDNVKLTTHPNELEFLLGRNTQYVLLEKDTANKEATVLVF